jgi:hypothetical protein
MDHSSGTVRGMSAAENVETFVWRDLRFHVVTSEPLLEAQVGMIRRALPKVASVGVFADVLGMVLGRRVRIRTVRPSPDVSFEVGL